MERIALNKNEKTAHIEGGGIEAVRLTRTGQYYIYSNPKLPNPINWSKIASIAAILSVLVSFLALFIVCF